LRFRGVIQIPGISPGSELARRAEMAADSGRQAERIAEKKNMRPGNPGRQSQAVQKGIAKTARSLPASGSQDS